jgi:hypothetical protein
MQMSYARKSASVKSEPTRQGHKLAVSEFNMEWVGLEEVPRRSANLLAVRNLLNLNTFAQ